MMLNMMKQTIYESVLQHLEDAKGNWPYVAAGSGISRRTIEKIARSETKNPGIHHIQILFDYFQSVKSKKAA